MNNLQSRISGVIVSGGLNSRMGGRNKAFLKIGNRTILTRLIDTLHLLFDDIVLVTRSPGFYSDYKVRIVTDIFEDQCSLTGIHSGIYHAINPYAFIVPCDAPFIQEGLVRLLVREMEPENDVVIPRHNGYYEPLCAIYSKTCLPHIEKQLTQKNYRIYDFFRNLNVKSVSGDKIRTADPGMLSFFNVNTPDALARSREMVKKGRQNCFGICAGGV